MRVSALLLPALALPATANVAVGAFNWAADVLGGNGQVAVGAQDVHVMDGWRWSDCGLPSDAMWVNGWFL